MITKILLSTAFKHFAKTAETKQTPETGSGSSPESGTYAVSAVGDLVS